MQDPAVRFDRVSKRFRLGETQDTLRGLLGAGLRKFVRREAGDAASTFWALREVSFAVSRGDTLGVIGPNGAGKSTVLKLLAGILRPEAGTVSVHGRLAALIEVGAGFHGDLTGRENVFLNGAILGMKRDEIRRKLDAIVAFAGIERFLDMPVKRYSSGMYARLGFSIAAHVEPEVLLVDEVLSVGDAVFRLRCLERMREMVREGTALIFVTHDLEQMRSICSRAIVLSEGRVAFEGVSRDAVGHYLTAMSRAFAERPGDIAARPDGENALQLVGLRWLDESGEECAAVDPRRGVRVEMRFQARRSIRSMVVELNMRTAMQEPLVSLNSGRDGVTYCVSPGRQDVTLTLPTLPVAGGQYFWNVRVWDADRGVVELDTPFRFPMVVHDAGRATGALCLEREWSLSETAARASSLTLTPTLSLEGRGGLVEIPA